MELFTHHSSLGIIHNSDINPEEILNNELVHIIIGDSFAEYRCFPFFPSLELINQLKKGNELLKTIPLAISIKNEIIEDVSKENIHLQNQLIKDIHLSTRIIYSILLIHQALSQIENSSLINRRFVIIKEKKGEPGILHFPGQPSNCFIN